MCTKFTKSYTEGDVTVPQTFTVAPYSEMEVLGEIPVRCRGDWIVENKILKKPHVIVVRAVVVSQNDHIPMCMLNLPEVNQSCNW